MSVLLAALAAVAYGLADFVGGVTARRAPAWSVAVVAQVAAAASVAALALVTDGSPTSRDLGWAAVAAVGSGVGTGFLYRGLAAGRMGVVAPVSAVGAALVPVAVGALGGERPGTLVWVGIMAALPGIWLVSSEPRSLSSPGGSGAGLVDGILAGLGFGVSFAAIGQVPEAAGLWPLALALGLSAPVAALLASSLRAAWHPRRESGPGGAVAGVLSGVALALFLLSTQQGLLAVSGVITSLYPAVTVLLATAVLRERIHTAQAVGLMLCGAAVVAVAVG